MSADGGAGPAVPELIPVGEITVQLGSPRAYGTTRVGDRRVTPILGGAVQILDSAGALPPVMAEILPGGADWQRVRPDGVIEIDARYVAVTPGGHGLILHVRGLRRVGPDGVYFRAGVTVEAGDASLAELERVLLLVDGVREAEQVRHTLYRVA